MGSFGLVLSSFALLATATNAAISQDVKSALSDACEADFNHPSFIRSRNVPSLPDVPIDHCKTLLDGINDINEPNPYTSGTVLMTVAAFGWGEVAKVLLEAGAEVDKVNSPILQDSALMVAAQHGWPNIIEILLSAGADINQRQMNHGYGDTALDIAKKHQHTQVVDVLKNHGATDASLELSDILQYHGLTPTQVNNYDEQEGRFSYGMTPIIWATGQGNKEACKLLIDAGADVNMVYKRPKGDEGTALMMAAKEGFTEIAQMLLEAGADVNMQNRNGQTALIETVLGFRSGHKDIAEMLIAAGADLNKRDNTKWTALKTAKRFKYRDIAKMLKEAGAEE